MAENMIGNISEIASINERPKVRGKINFSCVGLSKWLPKKDSSSQRVKHRTSFFVRWMLKHLEG